MLFMIDTVAYQQYCIYSSVLFLVTYIHTIRCIILVDAILIWHPNSLFVDTLALRNESIEVYSSLCNKIQHTCYYILHPLTNLLRGKD